MPNYVQIEDENEEVLGHMALPLSCYACLKKLVITKYNPNFSDLDPDIDEQLEVVYENCSKGEEMMMLLFLNDHSSFDEEDIEHFNKAIEDYPEDLNKTPRKALIKFRNLLEEKGKLTTKYTHSTSVVSVITK